MNDTLEVIDLESLLEDDLKCESRHKHPLNLTCSEEVTHFVRGCPGGVDVKVCQDAAVSLHVRMAGGEVCDDCLKPAADCWKVIAI